MNWSASSKFSYLPGSSSIDPFLPCGELLSVFFRLRKSLLDWRRPVGDSSEAHSFPSFYRHHTHYRSCVQKSCDSDFLAIGVEQMCSHICFVSNVYSVLFHHGVMAYPADFEFLLTQIDLPYLVTICCHICPSVDTDSIYVQHHLIRPIDFHVASMKLLYARATRC